MLRSSTVVRSLNALQALLGEIQAFQILLQDRLANVVALGGSGTAPVCQDIFRWIGEVE
jgi:hypothetical protein